MTVVAGPAGDRPDGLQHPAGDEPVADECEDAHDGEGDTRVDEELVRVGGALGGLGRSRLCHLTFRLGESVNRPRKLALVLGESPLIVRQL